jgi:nucleolin
LQPSFGYVEFANLDSATAAVEGLNQEVFQGRRLAVQFHRRREPINLSKPRTPSEPSKTLFIGNMSFEMSDKDLNDLFREVRNVIDVRVAIDRRTGQPRGFAHADFIDVDSAIKAREFLQEKEIYGRRLRVDYSVSSSGQKQV